MTTELDTVRPGDLTTFTGTSGANLIREAAAVMVDAHKLATAVAGTQMIPKHFQGKPDECAAAMLYGASLGLDPMQSVRQIYVVHGQAALYARAMVALVLGAGHDVWTVDSSDESVTVAARRRGSEHAEQATWTFARAKKAGYTNNSKYQTDPQAMLYSKAASEVCRKVAPDVLSGVYAVEELQMERYDVEQVATPPAASIDRMRAALAPKNPSPAQGVGAPESPDTTEDTATVEASAGEVSPPMSKRTRGQLFALFGQKGIVEAEQLSGVNHLTGAGYTSRSQITEADALAVIEVLKGRPDVVDVTTGEIVAEDAFGAGEPA